MSVEALSGLMLILVGLGVIVGILWVLLPFAVFGMKPLLREVLQQQRRTNDFLARAETARERTPGK